MRRLSGLVLLAFLVSLAGSQGSVGGSRGAYRQQGELRVARKVVSYQMSANAWQFRKGHSVRVEVTGNDAPYLRPNNQTVTANVFDMKLALPFRP